MLYPVYIISVICKDMSSVALTGIPSIFNKMFALSLSF